MGTERRVVETRWLSKTLSAKTTVFPNEYYGAEEVDEQDKGPRPSSTTNVGSMDDWNRSFEEDNFQPGYYENNNRA